MDRTRIFNIPTTGLEARLQCRTNAWDGPTAGIAPGYLQANLIVLPSRYAEDFKILCIRNTVPCPLLASSAKPGDFQNLTSHIPGISYERISTGLDIRRDIARYNVYINGKLAEEAIEDIESHWDPYDHVAFLIGCSFSFDNALTAAGLTPPHVLHGRNVSMYRTSIPLYPAGVFTASNLVVSMRYYRASEVEAVRKITRPYVTTHGEPVAWGWSAMRLFGIADTQSVDWGDCPVCIEGKEVIQSEQESIEDGIVPVFWGCGVTPQEAIMKARLPGVVMGHTPGHMLVLDLKEEDVLQLP